MREEDGTVFTSLVWAVVRGDGVRSGHIMNSLERRPSDVSVSCR